MTTTATTTLAGTTAPAGSATSSTPTTGPAKVLPRHSSDMGTVTQRSPWAGNQTQAKLPSLAARRDEMPLLQTNSLGLEGAQGPQLSFVGRRCRFSHGLCSSDKPHRPPQVREIKRFSLCSESASCRLPGISSQPRTLYATGAFVAWLCEVLLAWTHIQGWPGLGCGWQAPERAMAVFQWSAATTSTPRGAG